MTIPTNHPLYPTPERVTEARDILHRELITGEYLHPAVRANCEQVLKFNEEMSGIVEAESWVLTDSQYRNDLQEAREDGRAHAKSDGVWTMTESEFKEEIRKAKYDAYEEGWHGGAGWPQVEDNPYKAGQ